MMNMVLPKETASPTAEAEFGRKLAIITVIWIVATVLVGILLVLASPWLSGLV